MKDYCYYNVAITGDVMRQAAPGSAGVLKVSSLLDNTAGGRHVPEDHETASIRGEEDDPEGTGGLGLV